MRWPPPASTPTACRAPWPRWVPRISAWLGWVRRTSVGTTSPSCRPIGRTRSRTCRSSGSPAGAGDRAARVTVGQLEARLAELRRAESAARSELHQGRSEHDRTARSVTQRSDERDRETNRAQVIREELARATAKRDALTDA